MSIFPCYSADENSEVTITREGDYTRSSPTIAEEINIFKGDDSRFTLYFSQSF